MDVDKWQMISGKQKDLDTYVIYERTTQGRPLMMIRSWNTERRHRPKLVFLNGLDVIHHMYRRWRRPTPMAGRILFRAMHGRYHLDVQHVHTSDSNDDAHRLARLFLSHRQKRQRRAPELPSYPFLIHTQWEVLFFLFCWRWFSFIEWKLHMPSIYIYLSTIVAWTSPNVSVPVYNADYDVVQSAYSSNSRRRSIEISTLKARDCSLSLSVSIV